MIYSIVYNRIAERLHQLARRPGLMPFVDALLALAAFGLAYVVRYDLQLLRQVYEFNRAPFGPYIPFAAIFVGWLYLSYRGNGLYKQARGRSWLEDVYTIINGVTNATVVVMAISFIFQPLVFSRLMMIYVAAITIVLLAMARAVQRLVQANLRAQGIGVQRALVIGAGDIGGAVLRTMLARKELGFVPVGYLNEDPDRASVDLGRVKALGGLDNLDAVLSRHPVDVIVITLSWSYHDQIVALIEVARRYGVEVSVVPDVFQLNLRQVMVENLDGIPLLSINGHVPLKGSNRLLKRAMDTGLIILASPLLLLIFAVVGGGEPRAGRGGRFLSGGGGGGDGPGGGAG
ncbi:MAG: hypothetical protein GYB67_13660, partial [Chloroflexi bacterium]|nr:hypothetical protein [Chloroflexota bacterium]